MGLIQEKLSKGERADVLIVAAEVADDLQKRGVILGDSRQALAKVGIGVAVNEKAAAPDISTPEAFRQTLLNAKSIVYIDPAKGTSGKHLVTVFERLGVTAQVNAKAILGEGGNIVEPVGRGEVELGLHQISEILPVKGVKLVGPLPESLQKWTVYTAALTPASAQSQPARELIRFLAGADARAVFASRGYAAAD
jgi:molybdate transport system substrate-binding protein